MLFPSKEQIKVAFYGTATRNKKLSKAKVEIALNSLGFDCSMRQVQQSISQLPSSIEFNEFQSLVSHLQPLLSLNEQVLLAFKLFDSGSKGYITKADLEDVAVKVDVAVSNEEMQNMMKAADFDGDCRIGIEDFAMLIHKLGLI
jgi:Ca2+-binding EF-hand superfamily protein